MKPDFRGTAEENRLHEFDVPSALRWAGEGRIEAWVHRYLLAGNDSDREFSAGLAREPRWWAGPLEFRLADLSPAVGTRPGLEYVVTEEYWQARTRRMAASFTDPLAIPPLIVEYRRGELSIRDGNTRYGAMERLGWHTCWVILWYNSAEDQKAHEDFLQGNKTVTNSVK